jgi:hypothetical protein
MLEFRKKAASLRIKDDGLGLFYATFSGPMRLEEFANFRAIACREITDAIAVCVDVRSMVPLSQGFDTSIRTVAGESAGIDAPTAIICPAMYLPLWQKYALTASEFGMVRTVFVSPDQAMAWARRRVMVHSLAH